MAKTKGPEGDRTIGLDRFFVAPGETILKQGEILSEIIVPEVGQWTGGAYVKLMRRKAMDLPLVGVSTQIWLDKNFSICKNVCIALAVAAPVPFRAKRAEAILQGVQINDKVIEEAAKAAVQEAHPRASFRCSSEYRSEMIGILFKRAIELSIGRAREREEGR